jgi:putative transposase
MKDFKRLAHAVWECKVHIAWSPKYGFKILKGKVGRSVREIIKQLFEKVFDMNFDLKRRHRGTHFWVKRFCVSTKGLDGEQIRRYVKWQLHKDRIIERLKLWK